MFNLWHVLKSCREGRLSRLWTVKHWGTEQLFKDL